MTGTGSDDGLQLSPAAAALSELLERQAAGEEIDLEAVCAARPQHAAEIRRLHARLEAARVLREETPRDGLEEPAFGPAVPTRIGAYRIESVLGQGGMGTVYAARHVDDPGLRAAVKTIRRGLGGRRVLERFEFERRTLAALDHPNLAKVLDAGLDARGEPFLALELVDGPPLTSYCERASLGLRSRAELFLQVCAGVAHAHAHGVLHRDLKPSNVLVATSAGRPVPKVIDFGLARALDEAAPRAFRTTQGVVLGTPEYMSPEQAAAGSRAVDERSDVYALGILLDELLTGIHPYREVAGAGPLELLRRIVETVPTPPAERLRRDPGRETIAARRGLDSEALARALGGELAAILVRAVTKDPASRFTGAAEFAVALEPCLPNLP